MKTYNVKLGSLVLAAMLLTGTTLASNALGARKIKWAHVYETSEDYHKQAVWAAEEITKRSDGRYQVSVFPSSSLGKEADINQGLALGTVDIIYTGQSFAAQTYGPLALSDVPYVFRDFDHWQKYAKSDFFAEMADGYAKASGGHAIVADVYYGQRHVTSNKPIKTPEDMKGLKIRVPNAPLYRMFPEAVGGKTSPIAFAEVYLALQQGVVDAQENPLPTIKAKKFYEVQKYINLTGHLTGSNLIIIGAPLWKRLSDEDKAMFSEVLKKAAERVTADIVNAENELVEWFRSQGVTVLEIDRKPFRDMTVPFHMGAAATWTQEQYDKLQAIQ